MHQSLGVGRIRGSCCRQGIHGIYDPFLREKKQAEVNACLDIRVVEGDGALEPLLRFWPVSLLCFESADPVFKI